VTARARLRLLTWLAAVLAVVAGAMVTARPAAAAAPTLPAPTPPAPSSLSCSAAVLLTVTVVQLSPPTSGDLRVPARNRIKGISAGAAKGGGEPAQTSPDGVGENDLHLRRIVTGVLVYVNGDPVNLVDPNGHDPKSSYAPDDWLYGNMRFDNGPAPSGPNRRLYEENASTAFTTPAQAMKYGNQEAYVPYENYRTQLAQTARQCHEMPQTQGCHPKDPYYQLQAWLDNNPINNWMDAHPTATGIVFGAGMVLDSLMGDCIPTNGDVKGMAICGASMFVGVGEAKVISRAPKAIRAALDIPKVIESVGTAPRAVRALTGTAGAVAVIGRQADTAVAESWPGHEVLNLPNWDIPANDAWVRSVADRGLDVYTASPTNFENLWNAGANAGAGRETGCARGLRQFTEDYGCTWDGDYLRAPSP
jgi:hypothetical protein